jgi:hypothetical protein
MTFPPNDSSQRGDEIALSQEQLQKLGIGLLCLVVLLSIVGYLASPRDRDGKPILLSPEVKAVEDYRRSAQSWLDQLRTLDGEIAGLLQTDNQGDLFTQSRQAQQMLQHAVDLAKQVDQTQTPAAALGYHEQMYGAAMVYLEAARSGMRWVSAPEPSRKEDAQAKLGQAQAARKTLEDNEWMKIH